MDARVNDFLNEINEIAPLSDKDESVWEKCLDDNSSYYYYWNTKTNEVTWDMPSDYKPKSKGKNKQPVSLYIPPRTNHLIPSTSGLLPPVGDAIKIYKIGDCALDPSNKSKTVTQINKSTVAVDADFSNREEKKKKANVRKPSSSYRRPSSPEDEKIVLISSYGGDSESEDEKSSTKQSPKVNGSSKHSSTQNSDDEEDETDILTNIQRKAKELQKFGSDSPSHSAITTARNSPLPVTMLLSTPKPKIAPKSTGFSLIAGYSDSDEETPEEMVENKLPIIAPPPPQDSNKISHSTLFPAHKPIDLKDFETTSQSDKEATVAALPSTDFDSKVFSRKKRIGVSLVNTGKRPKADDVISNEGEIRKGLGFSNSGNSSPISTTSPYQGFKSGGVMFVKADILNPGNNHQEAASEENSKTTEIENKGIEDCYTTLKEKLGFLTEGRDPVFPVQAMLIQVETLHSALKAGDLKPSYLRKWLDETSSDLIKLEKETTPDGWLLQWDRYDYKEKTFAHYESNNFTKEKPEFPISIKKSFSLFYLIHVPQLPYKQVEDKITHFIRSHKRYYYQNEATGESQWEYPEADVTRCDEAMDICTTPPPCGAEQNIHMSPPLPPTIRSPSPPPPPTISECTTSSKNKNKKADIPLPPEPNPPAKKTDKSTRNEEPLPPGVDLPEVPTPTQNKPKEGADLNDALSSFYSDIAAIETVISPNAAPVIEDSKLESEVTTASETTKKKKKAKVKLAQGIAMKKKGVSKLVEKWKNVQMSYND